MTDASIALLGQQHTARAEQQAENSARQAFSFSRYTTTGTGHSYGQVTFDVAFVDEPRLLTGVVLERIPDLSRWRMPQVTAGVVSWTRSRQGPATLYVGAQLYFVIDCEPHYLPRTDGSDLRQRQARVQATPVADMLAYQNALMLLQEAQDALDLRANPPQVRVTHHLTFVGIGVKAHGLTSSTPGSAAGAPGFPLLSGA